MSDNVITLKAREQLKRELADLIDEYSPFTYKDWVTDKFLTEIVSLVIKSTHVPDNSKRTASDDGCTMVDFKDDT